MTILITRQNEQFFKEQMRAKSLNVVDSTTNTLTVRLSKNRFLKLRENIVSLGLNPYAVMTWI